MGILSTLGQALATPIENFLPNWLGRDLSFTISPKAGVESARAHLEEDMRELLKQIAPEPSPEPSQKPSPEPVPEGVTVTPSPIVYKLSAAARAEIITAMAGLTFQVDPNGSFSVVDTEALKRSIYFDRHLNLTVVTRAYFIERDRSNYHLSLEIFSTPERKQRYDISALEIGIQQLSGGVERYINPTTSGPGHILYENLETGIRYRFLTFGEAGIATTRPCVVPDPGQPYEESPHSHHLETSADPHH